MTDDEAEREAWKALQSNYPIGPGGCARIHKHGFSAGAAHARKQAEPEQRHNGPLDAFSIVGKDRDDWKRRALAAEQRIAALERELGELRKASDK